MGNGRQSATNGRICSVLSLQFFISLDTWHQNSPCFGSALIHLFLMSAWESWNWKCLLHNVWHKFIMHYKQSNQYWIGFCSWSPQNINSLFIYITKMYRIDSLPYLITMSLLKLVEIRPGISQVRLYLDRTIKPLPGLGYLSFCPKYVSEK